MWQLEKRRAARIIGICWTGSAWDHVLQYSDPYSMCQGNHTTGSYSCKCADVCSIRVY